eukprot:TRINITY_DN5329_c0_g1_i6.p1 TRINITY_DN5329_c0_g1~~TRINITY_DN5329_c0_g1_i6.p1  ORF type:complete len:122 (-),score=41.99 TRINITY_DN5329_c0_g1_i6:248-613(-)
MSFWETVKTKTAQGAAATSRAAQKAKLTTEIAIHNQKIKSLKEEFGVKVWDSMVSNDGNGQATVFNEYHAKVMDFERQIAEKNDKIAAINREGGDAGGDFKASGAESGYDQAPAFSETELR